MNKKLLRVKIVSFVCLELESVIKMFEIPENIVEFFFQEIHKRSKYNIVIEDGIVKIKTDIDHEYYKPTIVILDLEGLKSALINYVYALNEFYTKAKNLESYHDLSFFMNHLLLNMTSSDAQDFVSYIERRTAFFENDHFQEYQNETLLLKDGNIEYYVQNIIEAPGLETPYVLVFSMKKDGVSYPLPLVRYAFDENNVCHLFAIQFGRGRKYAVEDEDYKKIVNRINSGVNKYRNVSPSFVLSFKLFLQLLENYSISEIKVPDFLFGRYKNYFGATTTVKSDEILNRIVNRFLLLMQRVEYQFTGFEVTAYPNDIDSYTHIRLNGPVNDRKKAKEKILEKNLTS